MDLFSYFINNFDVVMQRTLEHLFIFFISWILSVVVGVFIGIYITREKRKRYTNLALTITGITQSIPSVAVIALIFLFMGIGKLTAIIALFLYGLVPIVFNTTSGIVSISPKIIEIAKGMGMNEKEILYKIEIPIALPAIFSGLRNSAIINIATATVASVIGGGGLGVIIFTGLSHYNAPIIFAGALPVSVLAIGIDIVLELFEKKWVSKGLINEF
ncbi:osmoprotectant transport system permease protein [Marinitoga hydrogenitolerans DSM 16785]|uniref:Osmoprotectant transport system permease protein n=1 Tax=Marinitoga hydrogenitolerans (strain DSM 16785 / JCM 12826 / AT1271) TaxID=1122195 RepID=A0A1M4UCW5_MARH1|nr:ABC transporter permease [Marinitoga hydrogenitolerans]SHE54400.1 osmoprotectant transport system permease protein [Marinitoga hydrogenitolerans DSM 16785]